MRNKVRGLQFITSPTLTSRLCGYGHPAAWAVGLRMVLSNMLSLPERIFNTCRGEVMWSSESLRLSPSPKRSEVIPYSTLLKLEFIIFYPFSLKGLYKLCLLPHKTWVFPAHKQVRTSAMHESDGNRLSPAAVVAPLLPLSPQPLWQVSCHLSKKLKNLVPHVAWREP